MHKIVSFGIDPTRSSGYTARMELHRHPSVVDVPAAHTDRWDRRAAWIAAGLLIVVAACCLARGLPWPNVDDLAFVGASLDLVRTGELVNHAMDGWLASFGTSKFYIQLPFSIYSLALWFRLFGVSTASLLVLQWSWCLAGTWALVRTLGRFGMALGLRLFLATLYLRFMLSFGCRPEPETFALLFLGLALMKTPAPFPRRSGALTLFGFATLCYPLAVTLALPFGVALAWLTLPPDLPASGRWRALFRAWVVPALIAAAVTFLVFLAMIHGDLAAFLTVFNAHRHSRASTLHPFMEYLHMITQYNEAVLTLPTQALLVTAAVWVALRWRWIEAGTRTLVAACAVAALGCILLYADKAATWIGLLAFIAASAVVSSQGLRRWRWPLALALAALYVFSQTLSLLDFTLRVFPDPAVWRAARATAAASGKSLMVDHSTARYVFGYQLPPGTRDADFTASTDRKPNEIHVVTAVTPCSDAQRPPTYKDWPRLRIGHHEFRSIPFCPDQPLIEP